MENVNNDMKAGQVVVGLGRESKITGRYTPWNPQPVGTIRHVDGDSVFVQWHDSIIEDEMRPWELALWTSETTP